MEFLDDVMEDTTDVYNGQLSIDLDMANNKDIDDGKTVTGMMDKMQEQEQQLEDAFNEIKIWDNALEDQERALAQQRADNAALQAQLAVLQSQASDLPTMMGQPSPTPPHNNRESPERQALTPPVRSSNRTLGKSSTGQSTMVPNTLTQPKKATKQGKPPKQPAKKGRISAGVQFQEPSSAQPLAALAVQCGSRKQHQSIDLALSKRLIWDSLILERRSSGWISNDAKSCFDRIVHWVAKTALRRFGLPVTVTNLMFDILAKAKHRVRAGFGNSDLTFGPTGDVPFQGCEAEGFGYMSNTALTNEEFFALCFCFVDDTDVMESNDNVETTGEDLLPLVQSALDLWSGGISATGGAINPAKSFWWLIDFKWRPSSGTWVFRRKAEMPGELTLQDPTGPWATLRRLQPDEAERTLGVMMAPLETGTAQHLALREKAKNWAAKFLPQHLLHYDVLPLLKATAMKTLEYVMPLSTLGRSDWVSIMSPILQASLHKAGVCRSFPRVVVFAPLKYQGLGIPHPFALQVFHHLSFIMRHLANRTETGQYLEANLQSHQLETGTSFPLLQQEPTNTGILASKTWLKRGWIELDSLGIRVEISSPPLSLHCVDDRLLMDIFIDALVDQEDLLWLNYYNWPRTRRPGPSHWDLWRRFLSQAVLRPYSRRRRLLQPLGPWSDSLDRWTWLFSCTTLILFHWTDKNLAIYRPINSRSHKTFRRDLHHTWTGTLPGDVQWASVNLHPRTAYITVTGTAPVDLPDQESLPASILHIWRELAADMDDNLGWVPEYIYIEGDEQVLLEALEKGKLRVISDGSFKQQVGTAAVQLRT
ncbi:unnamed protein product [Cylindrotheca closterium]|uniref:Uncharacterized protein n=1 Tax=Cylindrotheca closterium TaxID=2856 RepID=A0AAD2FRX0_9STRA|nr:unnamed protein product [Cylindrotheca closterium]CAJ1950927.1 unnamed protein product [Cylindrotheca closterium]